MKVSDQAQLIKDSTYRIDVGDDANVAGGLGEQIMVWLRRQQPPWSLHMRSQDSTGRRDPSDPHAQDCAVR